VRSCRLHITGASGVGATTLGRAVAGEWSVPHADADDYFWLPTTPPYSVKRPVPERLALMEALFLPRDAWVLSGSVMGWAQALTASFDAVVFLTLEGAARLRRLRVRETARYGAGIEPGGEAVAAHQAFLDWASGYDDPRFPGRSRVQQEEWLSTLTCPVLHLDSAEPVARLVAAIRAWAPEASGT
jgi:adenylate kinase family enzyme